MSSNKTAQTGEWVTVPRDPTPEMFAAASRIDDEMAASGSIHGADSGQVWEAMLAAAPPAPAAEPVMWTETDIVNMRVAFSKRFNEPLPRTETLIGVAAVGYRKALGLDPVINLYAPPPVEASQRRWTGIGHLEQTGYIPAGSAAEREASQQQCPELARPISAADVKDARDSLDVSRTADEMQSVIGQLGYGVEFCNGWAACVAYTAARTKEQASQQKDWPECSGDPMSCPENEGYGCCKPNRTDS